MYISSVNHKTYLSREDIQKITELAKYLIDRITPPQLGLYKEMSEEELWFNLILKICTVGGADMLYELEKDEIRLQEFRERLSLSVLLTKKELRREYIAGILKEYKATRFYNKQAEKIHALLSHPSVIYNGHFVLLDDIDHNKLGYKEIRNLLIKRNSYFKLKSASEYMIEVGMSIDVIGLNTGITDVLRENFGLEVDRHKLQDTKYMYESVEDGLRRGCEQIGIPLAYLDRMIYHYSQKDAISFILEDL
jgi:thermostable 8-oxoguanine DNA glycosylase